MKESAEFLVGFLIALLFISPSFRGFIGRVLKSWHPSNFKKEEYSEPKWKDVTFENIPAVPDKRETKKAEKVESDLPKERKMVEVSETELNHWLKNNPDLEV